MITVYYDGKCSLCSAEIEHYRKIAPAGVFNWQDITESADALTAQGISLVAGLKQLHAQDDQGRFYIGVDAFILMWRQLHRWRILGNLVALPGIKQIAELGYRLFANWRFKRLEHCQVAASQQPRSNSAEQIN